MASVQSVDAAPRPQRLTVVKVGGSLAETGALAEALDVLVRSEQRLVIVPGGGRFADKVRDLQTAVGFDDGAAHRLAMLGMHQMAETFVSLNSSLTIIDDAAARDLCFDQDRVPIWVPLPTLDGDDSIPQNWDTTSDTIAAWLAHKLACPLVLFKSVDIEPNTAAEALTARGIVDRAFANYVARHRVDWRIIGPTGLAGFNHDLRGARAQRTVQLEI